MSRIAGVDLIDSKRVDIALTVIYGIGRHNVVDILDRAKVESAKRVKDLTEDELGRLQRIVDKEYKVEGDLKEDRYFEVNFE